METSLEGALCDVTASHGVADMEFPSVPKGGLASRPSDVSTDAGYAADYAAAAAASGNMSDDSSAPAEGQLPRFARGQKVLYDSFEQPLPVQGTVAKIDRAGDFFEYFLL